MNIMIDLETMGTSANSVILSIGAVAFNKHHIEDRFEVFIDVDSQRNRIIHHDTLKWWLGQSPEAQKALTDGMGKAVPMVQALIEFQVFVLKHDGKIWGNGSDFDNALLQQAFCDACIPTPWKFWNNRCYRTIKSTYPQIKADPRIGVYHSAVDDAEFQAVHLMKIAKEVTNARII